MPTSPAGCLNCWGVILMKRDRAYYRYQKKRHIRRKIGILQRIGGEDDVLAWSRGQPGRLSKGKIHCSCWMCRTKSYDEPSHGDKKSRSASEQQRKAFLQGLEDWEM